MKDGNRWRAKKYNSFPMFNSLVEFGTKPLNNWQIIAKS